MHFFLLNYIYIYAENHPLLVELVHFLENLLYTDGFLDCKVVLGTCICNDQDSD